MKVYFLISGLLRTFFDDLYPFLCEVSNHIDCEFLLCIANDTIDTYYTKEENSEKFHIFTKNPRSRLSIIDSISFTSYSNLNQREKNIIYQWYRIQKCFQFLLESNLASDDLIIRIRPDIQFNITPSEFVSILYKLNSTTIYIPSGNDIFNVSMLPYVKGCINDHIAIGSYKVMKVYCNLYSNIDFKQIASPIISEQIVYTYLKNHTIPIERIEILYKIYTSNCKVIAIAGDSGSGKSTILESVNIMLPRNLGSILETDGYHKWERNHENWKQLTHLNPDANHLEKMTDDIYLLKSGEIIEHIDYNHTTGKFTDSYIFKMNKILLLCGLHTLYKKELRNTIDYKLYINTEYELKRFWKIQRDMKKRKYTFEKATSSFLSREKDYKLYIEPQIEFADIIFHYFSYDSVPIIFDTTTMQPSIQLCIELKNVQLSNVHTFLEKVSVKIEDRKYTVDSIINKSKIIDQVSEIYKKYIKLEYLNDGILGIIQCLFILLIYNNE